MNDIEPIAVALKFGFIAVLYLFLLWVARAAMRDMRATADPLAFSTGLHPAEEAAPSSDDAVLVVEEGGGLTEGERFDLFGGVSLGRSADADIRVDDRYASQIHARVFSRDGIWWVEDLKSTNGTLLNSADLHGEAELAPGDEIRIGDTQLRFEPGS